MKSVLLLALSLLWIQQAASQSIAQLRSTTASSGNSSEFHHSGNVYVVQQSIGQPGVTGSFLISGQGIHQGFLQPHKLHTTNHQDEGHVRIYPNPYLNDFTVALDQHTESLSVEITDLMGRIVFAKTVTSTSTIDIHEEELAAGQYFIRLSTTKRQYVGKIVKR